MRTILCAACAGFATMTLVVSAQKRVSFDGKGDYVLTVEKQSAAGVNATPFIAQNTLEGYCWNLNTLPLADRPQLGDKAKVLRVGGAGQLTQVVEIPPGRKTVWHGYGWEGMSAAGLNTTLKTIERLTRQIASDPAARRAAELFQLGVELDGLAALMNQEVESHGMQERELLDLALSRTRELGIAIAYSREKKKFFYDGAAFSEYLKVAPRGPHAAAAEFQLLSYSFYQSLATDVAALTAAAAAKERFLARYPNFRGVAEVRLYLAVDYRDLSRQYRSTGDAVNARKYERLTRSECARIVRLYPRTNQADAARQMLAGLR